MGNELLIFGAFIFLCFVTVPVRTVVQNRRDSKFRPFIIGQLIYSFFWFATYAIGMVLLVQFVVATDWSGVFNVILAYTTLTTAGSSLMLLLQKQKEEKMRQELIRRQKQSKGAKLPYRPKKGAKVLN